MKKIYISIIAGLVLITAAIGGQAQILWVHTISATPLTDTITNVTNVTCYGMCNGTATVTAYGGTSPYTYLWNPGGQTNATITGLCQGTYTVVVTDAASNTATATVTITQPSMLFVNTSVLYNPLCNGGTGCAVATITGGSPPYTYVWFPSGNTTDTACGLSAGTYTITGVDSNGCTATGTVTLTDPPVLTGNITATGNNTSCSSPNGYATVTAAGGTLPYTYSWWPSGGTNTTATNLAAGSYTCTVTDNHGCTATVPVTIGGAGLTVTITSVVSSCTTICAFANVSGGVAPFTYLWAPTGQTTDTICGPLAGSYTCTVTDKNGCTCVATDSIFPAPLLSLAQFTTADTGSCSGTALVWVGGGTPPYTYLWSPGGQTNSVATGLCAGTYCCTVTDFGGCTDSICMTVLSMLPTGCSGNSPSLCYVTSDTNSTHNILYWDRTGIDTNVVDSFYIYRGVTTFIYNKIAAISVHSHTVYADITSKPTVESYYYELGIADTCHDSITSPAHQSILLQASWALSTTMNLSWNYYQGAIVNYYAILRDDSGMGKWHKIDSVPGGDNAYTDYNAPINNNLRYRLSVNWDVICTPYLHIKPHGTSEPAIAYSNITNLKLTGIDGLNLLSYVSVYPNPADNLLNVSIDNMLGEVDFYLTDVLGQKISAKSYTLTANSHLQTINIESLRPGTYFLVIESNGQKVVKKITKL